MKQLKKLSGMKIKTIDIFGLLPKLKIKNGIAIATVLLATFLLPVQAFAADTSLNFISFTSLPDEGVELHLTFSGPPPEPTSFTTNNPARITLDLPGVAHNLPWSLPLPIEVGAADTVSAIEASGRTRVVINLKNMIDYESRVQGNSLYVTLGVSSSGASSSGEDSAKAATTAESAVSDSSAANVSGKKTELKDVSFVALPGDRALVTLRFSGPPPKPESFTIDEPARIALDFPDTSNRLPWRTRNIGIGMARSVTVVEADGRTRVVLNLVKLLPYETRVEGKTVSITLKSEAAARARSSTSIPLASDTTPFEVTSIDFRRGENGEGRVIVNLSDANAPIDTREAGGKIFVDFPNATLPENLHQRLDVMDFATPVQFVDATSTNNQAQLTITPKGPYEYLAFQSDNTFTIEVKPISEEDKKGEIDLSKYTGEKLSLNFQDIEVRSVLQLLADFTGLNMVTSDTVQGSLTLRLKNVPWDQALDIILKTKGLGMRQSGNVMMIAPGEEIAAREKLELEALRQVEELVPLKSELIQINFAKASELSALLSSQDNTLLSSRGKISIDERTNTLLVLDTSERLAQIRRLVDKLDVPIRQVLIEARIVVANDDFAKDLGVKFGVTGVRDSGNNLFMSSGSIGGSNGGTDSMVGSALANLDATGQPLPIGIQAGDDANAPTRLNFNLPAPGNAGSVAFAILGSNTLIDLELSALQTEGKGEVISSPRIVTSDQREAVIRQGTQIPFQEAASSGATSVRFKDAVLSLTVTPQITPDDRILMNLRVTKDSVGAVLPTAEGGSSPSIDTREISTEVLVKSGETVVLGGIHEQTKRNDITKIPFFGDIPFIGALFRNKSIVDQNSELLIFVTPKVLKDNINLN
ncbi:MAG: type IV pilus secretin PilQ [Gammaproteobacteria bacterium]|nr:type IV pilus secretin PilQ [Gammaproteobacteria bacterium]